MRKKYSKKKDAMVNVMLPKLRIGQKHKTKTGIAINQNGAPVLGIRFNSNY